MSAFTWIPFYKELAGKLMAYRDRQDALIAVLKEIKDKDLPVISLNDKAKNGKKVPLSAIDPFTFFAAFNRKATDKNRQAVLMVVKERFQVAADVPTDFDGIPIMHPMMSRFVPWEADRKGDDIPALWAFAEAVVNLAPEAIAPELFNRCLEIECVSVTNLTMGMFWMRPDTYLALDSRNCALLDKRNVPHDVHDWASYLFFLDAAATNIHEKPYEFSHAAFTGDRAREFVPRRTEMQYWIYAPGKNAMYWDEYYAASVMGVGWDDIKEDLSGIQTEKEVWERHAAAYGKKPGGDVKGLADFVVNVRDGDGVFVKKGMKELIGYGVVKSKCFYDSSRSEFRHLRKVEWQKKGSWPVPKGMKILPRKTITPLTDPERVAEMRDLLGIVDTLPRKLALNTILYGPPGTGKTWTLRNEYMKHFTEHTAVITKEEFAASLVTEMTWWQVITMVMLDLKTSKVSRILEHPLMQARIRQASNRNPRAAVWAHLQMHTKADCPEVKYAKRYEPLLFSKDAKSVWSIDETLAAEETADLVEALDRYRGFKPGQGAVIKRYEFTTFHQSYSYEDFVEGIKPVMSEEVTETLAYEVKPGIFKAMVQRALADPEHDYALLIDEISRGNVANIFGELITLIEDDKRKDAANELTARLPYSRDEFVVPKNLYIIGAMNTADRSVEALDTALRRRFTFVAVPPRPDLIEQPASLHVDLCKLLTIINARIERLLDKDHCIGHSYFMGMVAASDPLAELRHVFATKILPLMEEYFYGDPAKIGMVLGERFVSRNDDAPDWAQGDWGVDEFEERQVYTLRDPLTLKPEDFRTVYE